MKGIRTWLKDGWMFLFCSAGVECVHCSGYVSASDAHITNYHPSQLELLGIRCVTWAVDLLTYFVDWNDVSPKEKHDRTVWIELWNEVKHWLKVRVLSSSTWCWISIVLLLCCILKDLVREGWPFHQLIRFESLKLCFLSFQLVQSRFGASMRKWALWSMVLVQGALKARCCKFAILG